MANISNDIISMKSQTAVNQSQTTDKASKNDLTDSNMFLTLMMKQMEFQDPTEPVDNTQWMAQMAQYSSLESMNKLNSSFSNVTKELESMNDNILMNGSITQTLSLVGKEVTISVPEKNDKGDIVCDSDGKPKYKEIKGTVDEASFKDGVGEITVGGTSYPIGYVTGVKNPATLT